MNKKETRDFLVKRYMIDYNITKQEAEELLENLGDFLNKCQ